MPSSDDRSRKNSLGTFSQGSFRPGAELLMNKKSEQRNRLRVTLDELNEANQRHEDDLTTQLAEHESKNESVQSEKTRIKSAFRMQRDQYGRNTKKVKDSLCRLTRELGGLEKKSRNLEALLNQDYLDSKEAFEYSLKPLEDAAAIVADEKNEIEENITSLNAQLNELKSCEKVLSLESDHSQKVIDELTQKIEQHQKGFEEIKNEFPLETKEIIQELETKKTLQRHKENKIKKQAALRKHNKALAELENDIHKATEDLERWERQRVSNRRKGAYANELVELEKYLKLRCADFGLVYLNEAVELAAQSKSIDIEECILKEQFKLMEKEELSIIELAKGQEEEFQQKIAELTKQRGIQQKEMIVSMATQENNSTAEPSIKKLENFIRQLKKQGEDSKRTNASHIDIINRWKAENRRCLLAPNIEEWPKDSEILSHIQDSIRSATMKKEQAAAIESVLSRYIKLVNEREGVANAASEIEVKALNELKEQEAYIQKLKTQKSSLDFERDNAHKEYLWEVNLEKSTLKKFQTSKYEIEVERRRLINMHLHTKMKKKADGFQKLQKALGEKKMKQFKDKMVNTLKFDYETRQKKVRHKLEDWYSNFTYWEGQLQQVTESSVHSQIEQNKEEIRVVDRKIRILDQQLLIVLNAEDEIKAKLQAMVQDKNNEISAKVSNIMKRSGGGIDNYKISQLKNLRAEQEEELRQLEEKLSKERNTYGAKMEKIEIEETRVKGKLAQLREEVEVVVSNKKKSGVLQKKLQKLEKEMEGYTAIAAVEAKKAGSSTSPRSCKELVVNEYQPSPNFSFSDEHKAAQANEDKEERIEFGEIIESPFASPINMSEDFSRKNQMTFSKVFIDDSGVPDKEKLFYKAVFPLLEGSTLYKKVPSKQLNNNQFDPLVADVLPLASCGFEPKFVRLNRHLNKIEIRHTEKPGIESTIMVNQLLAPNIPVATAKMIKAQKSPLVEFSEEFEAEYAEMKRTGIVEYNAPAVVYISQKAKGYPFSVQLDKGQRVEFVAEEYALFSTWVKGINALLAHRDSLSILKFKVEQQ